MIKIVLLNLMAAIGLNVLKGDMMLGVLRLWLKANGLEFTG